MGGAVFGEVELSLFVAGAVFREIWNDSRTAKNNLGCEAGCRLTGSWSDHARIMVGSCSDHDRIMLGKVSDRSCIVNDVSAVLVKFVSHFGRSFFVARAVFGEVGQ